MIASCFIEQDNLLPGIVNSHRRPGTLDAAAIRHFPTHTLSSWRFVSGVLVKRRGRERSRNFYKLCLQLKINSTDAWAMPAKAVLKLLFIATA
jgi:hypothetical protein